MPNTIKGVEIDPVREKLIELLMQAKIGWTKAELADHLIANGVTFTTEWIPVTERLPENKGNYLGFTGSTSMVGYYKGNGMWWIWLKDIEGENLFTHWMPLPEPPKGE